MTLSPSFLAGLRRVLRPLVRLLVARGMTYPMLSEVLKETYVDVADRDFCLENKPATDSRVSLLSGVHRKDVRRLRGRVPEAGSMPESVALGAQLVAAWSANREFRDAKGRPRPLPRLPELRATHPALHLDIDTGGHATARLGDGIDAAIVLAREIDPALYAKRLDRNEVFAIASTELLVGGEPLTEPKQLTGVTVFLHRDMPDTYEEWRKAVGIKNVEPAAIDLFDSGQLMLDAAAQGLGVAFMHGSHLSSAQDARLTRVFDVEVESPYSYWFVCRPRALEARPVKLFHDWLVGTMAATI